MPLHTRGLTHDMYFNELEEPPNVGETPTMSSFYANASTLLARSVIASTSYLPLLLFEVALSLNL